MRQSRFIYEEYLKVVDYFEQNHNNETKVIAEKLGIYIDNTNYYIDLYLSQKRNYNGDIVTPPMSYFNVRYKAKDEPSEREFITKLRVIENYKQIGIYKSMAHAEKELKLIRGVLALKLRGVTIGTITHREINRTLTYEKFKIFL